MADETFQFEKIDGIRDASLLESKIREKIYELQIKRKFAEDCRAALSKLDTEKHNEIQRAEKAERELYDTKIHLEVAINAAREAEAERSSARELLARQRAQLETNGKEREILQQLNRSQQLEISKLQRELEECKSKMNSQTYILDVVQKKDTQIRSTLATLTCEVLKLESSQSKLKDMFTKISSISKAIIFLLDQRKTELLLLKKEKKELQDSLISLNVKMGCMAKEKPQNFKKEKKEALHILEWESAQREMQSRMEDSNQEINRLQSSLESALASVARYQGIDQQNYEKIKLLEEELKSKNINDVQKEDKSVQAEEIESISEVINNKTHHVIMNPEIQYSEVDTCEGS